MRKFRAPAPAAAPGKTWFQSTLTPAPALGPCWILKFFLIQYFLMYVEESKNVVSYNKYFIY